MKKLKIAQIAPLWFSIPPEKYGGTERIVHFLTEGLVKKGHDVTLFASGDSKTKAKLISVIKKGLIYQGIPWHDWRWNNSNYSVAFERANEFDIIHSHCSHWNILGADFQKLVKTPLLHTFHNIPKKSDPRWKIFDYYKNDINIVFISKSEKRNCPVKFKRSWVVYNGIDLNQFKFNPNPKDYFVWIARISKAKGIENAILAAEKTGVKLLLAGPIKPTMENYFKTQIKPRLTKKIKYVGELPQEKLSDFYGSAKACLYPIEWEEPFGLIMAESMACGTPVIAFDRGSVREVVKDRKTGFIVKNIEEMIEAIKKIDEIKRENCRAWVKKKFTIERMVNDYEKVFYQIIRKGS
jgi:glycosyltransferase involved in cell wall biosynthesis